MKIRPFEAEMLFQDERTDRQTDIKRLTFVFISFTNARIINQHTYIITTHRLYGHNHLLIILLCPIK